MEQWKGEGGGQRGRRKRRREDKKEQKQDKRFGHIVVIKNPIQIQRTAHRQTTVFPVAVETTAEKRAQCHDRHMYHHPSQTLSHQLSPGDAPPHLFLSHLPLDNLMMEISSNLHESDLDSFAPVFCV